MNDQAHHVAHTSEVITYVCPMHSEVRQEGLEDCPKCGMHLIPLVLSGFLVQWPTLLTLAMYSVLIWMYVRLAHAEEADSRTRFGDAYERYAETVPAFIPNLKTVRDDDRQHDA